MPDKNIIILDDNDFSQVIKETKALLLVDFWAAWCGPCQRIAPSLLELAEELSGKLLIAKLNVDNNPDTPFGLRIRSIPTMVLFKEGREIDRLIGYKTKKQLQDWLENHIANNS